MGRIIGIDLGTTNSVGAFWKGKKPKIIENDYSFFTPSVLWIERGIERVGKDAKDRMEGRSLNIIYSIKRFMGVDYDDPNAQKAMHGFEETYGGVTRKWTGVAYTCRKARNGEIEVLLDGSYYTPIQISAMVLKQIKRDAEIKLGEEVTHAVITAPAYFGQRQKNATREAGLLAGLVVSRIINEPTAAALAFGVEEEIDEPQDILVFDLGGGTFDVSILSIIDNNFDVLSIDGDRFLGGDDFDGLIAAEMLTHIRREYRVDLADNQVARMQLKALAEKVKINLSRQDEARVIDVAIAQAAGGRLINLSMTITRSQFESWIEPLVTKSIDITMRALEGAGLKPSDLDRVLLVGGSTRVPMIRQRLKQLFGDKIQIDVDPMQCVALGAAVQTAFLADDELQGSVPEQSLIPIAAVSPVVIERAADLPVITMQDMISKYIGVETEGGELVTVIPKGTLYPTHDPYRRDFHLNRQGQQLYELPVFESEREDAPRDQWEWIGVVVNGKLPPGLPKTSDVMVEMSIDRDGILTVASYLKNDPLRDDTEKGTLVNRSFHFRGQDPAAESDVIGMVDFRAFMLDVIANTPTLNQYLEPQQIALATRLATQAPPIIQARDEVKGQILLDHMNAAIDSFPAPVYDKFWALLITQNKEVVSPVERSEVQQIMTQLDNAANRGDIDTANQHLARLRQRNSELIEKYPTNLLRRK